MDANEQKSDRPTEVRFAASTTSVDAIQRAAYRFGDRFSVELLPGVDEHICILRSRDDADLDEETENFRVEVLDQTLRVRIRKETEPIRTMILAKAFSRTGVVDPQDLD
ncbi:MAG: His-Xaa-Ser system protein HxsD [Actinobacteria bacterium]|nr:His-Xaa-Ser system protein HxsD [Actinomycetota bacterium]